MVNNFAAFPCMVRPPFEIAGLQRRGVSQFLAGGYSNQIVFVQLTARQFKLVAGITVLCNFNILLTMGGKQKWEFLYCFDKFLMGLGIQ